MRNNFALLLSFTLIPVGMSSLAAQTAVGSSSAVTFKTTLISRQRTACLAISDSTTNCEVQ